MNTKTIKRRMKSVSNTKKITKAMEMVSAAKMRRAVESALATRPFAEMALSLMRRLALAPSPDRTGDALLEMETGGHTDIALPLLEIRQPKKILTILVTANRGLAGSFNANLLKKMISSQFLERADHPNAEAIVGIGKKSAWIAKKLGLPLIAVFDAFSDRPSAEAIYPVAKMAMEGFLKKEYDRVFLIHTQYQSSLLQLPVTNQLLPILPEMLSSLVASPLEHVDTGEFLCEPSLRDILNAILPRLVEAQVYQAILESLASEHSARMVAMKNATEAASDILSDLRLSFNKARQASITQELSEIVGGAAALG